MLRFATLTNTATHSLFADSPICTAVKDRIYHACITCVVTDVYVVQQAIVWMGCIVTLTQQGGLRSYEKDERGCDPAGAVAQLHDEGGQVIVHLVLVARHAVQDPEQDGGSGWRASRGG